ncbi:MAG: VanW family protein [Peptostreptococcaceae bacterium]
MSTYNNLIKKLLLILCLCMITLLTLGIGENDDEDHNKIYKNIYIENIEISKLTKKEAKDKVGKYYTVKPINIHYNDKKWCISPDDIGLEYNLDEVIQNAYSYTRNKNFNEDLKRKLSLKFKEPLKLNLEATYDESKLSNCLESICNEIDVSVKEATIIINDNSEIKITESEDGREVDIIKLKEIIYNMINKKDIKDVNLPVKVIKPNVNKDSVKSINTVLGQYSTSFNDYTARGTNIYVAGKSSSDILIMPGDTFSLNKATGARTWSKGYKTAKVIVGGKYVDGEGGGVCQVSTTIYNAALLAGMEIQEVHNHTYPSRYAPRGRDSAISYGYTDFKFKNPYSHPIYIKNIVNNGAITSKIYGCDEDREKLYIRTEENYSKDNIYVKTYRIYLDEENNKIREELIFESKYKTN